ncbi:MAG: DUF481 domain-containing protein [Myxococcota bacterium]|nr:DUF481 domain-containing protein [Myxococcota bacterium]
MPRSLSIPLALVVLGSVARADTLVLENGDKLTGEIVEWAVEHVVIEHPQLGTMRLSLDQLKIDTGKPPSPGLFNTRLLRGWKRTLSFGMLGEAGESLTLRGGAKFGYADAFKRWRLTGRYYYNQNDDDENDNNSRIDLRRDWLVPTSKWFTFAAFRHQYDDTENWRNRFTSSLGPGYNVFTAETAKLEVFAGPVYVREQGNRRDNIFDSIVGLDFEWQITERIRFELHNGWFTELSPDLADLRNLSIGALSYKISDAPSLSLVLNGENEYEYDDDDGVSNTLNYSISLDLDF